MYLKHYGILGMRWGIRRFQNKDGTLTDIGKERYAKSLEDGKNKRVRIGRSGVSGNSDFLKTLSDDELKRLVNRLNLEQQYLNLTKNSQTNLRGYDFVKKVIRDANLVNSSLDAAISFMSKYKTIKEIVENQMKKNRD